MKTNKLILVASVSISLLVNIPRIIFLFGNEGAEVNSLLEVSVSDTLFRILMMFSFCLVVLKFNLEWREKIKFKQTLVIAIIGNLVLLGIWTQLFRVINLFVYEIDAYTIRPGLNSFVYIIVIIILLLISYTIKLNNQSKLDAIEKEQLKQQNLTNELAALRNQINPHFLFNSLNSLSLLVREDQKAAGKFINQLSFLYRYILQSKDQDLVTIKEELKFLNSYIYLIKQRYEDNFNVNINIDEHLMQKKIPTLALQLLLENAVKHNEISTKKPLRIDILSSDNQIIVKNKLQERKGHVESTNTGLSNLNTRFQLQMNKPIEILKIDDYFIVKLPIV